MGLARSTPSLALVSSLGRQILGTTATLAFGAALVTLWRPWHEIWSVDPKRAMLGLYFGPDVHLTDEARARFLEPSVHSVCTGMTHFSSPWPAVILALCLLDAAVLTFSPLRRWGWLFVGAVLVLLLAFSWATFLAGLTHSIDRVGPPLVAQDAFAVLTHIGMFCLPGTALGWIAALLSSKVRPSNDRP